MKFPITKIETTSPLSAPGRFLDLYLARSSWFSPALWAGIGLLGSFLGLMMFVQFSTPDLVGNDSYFHIKFAQVMREQGLLPAFIWLPLTILEAERYYDHHFLYHVLLIPFTYGDLRLGAKWASVVFPAAAFWMGWLFLRRQQVPYAALWSFGFFGVAESFLYRLSMTRVQAVSLLMFILMLQVCLSRSHRWLLPLSFVYIWLYDGFPLVLGLVGCYVGARLVVERQLDLWPLVYTVLGTGLGLLINPYFPDNIIFIYHHFWPKLFDTGEVRVGQEWYPYTTWALFKNTWPALLLFFSGAFGLGLRGQRLDVRTATLFLVATFFGLLLLKSRRFIEYYPAFALLFGAVAWAPLWISWQQSGSRWARALPLGLALIIGVIAWSNIETVRTRLQEDSLPYERYAAASAWLQANTPPGSRVFQTDWDDFTQLYYYNIHNTYVLGLDPTYMHQWDAELYELWRDTSRGWGENLGRTIRQSFGAEYALTDLKHQGFLDKAAWGSGLEEVYRDEYAVIFRVVDQ